MKNLILAAALAASFPALASVSCYDNGHGTTTCNGTDASGRQVATSTYDNGHGTKVTTGSVGGQSVNVTCYDNGHGTTTCN